VAYFPDLSPYTYLPGVKRGTLNVGWLDPSASFPTGDTSEEFRAKLFLLCQRPFRQTRGFHCCPYCPVVKWPDGPMGSYEMEVAYGELKYAAPSLIHHYVVTHGYKPPEEFIAAVLAWDDKQPEPERDQRTGGTP
jgi:hypothetical protein